MCSGFIAENSLTDPCFLYVFQIALNHKPFFAKNSLETKPPNRLVCSGSAPSALMPGFIMAASVLLCKTAQREARMANKSYFPK